MRRDETDLYTHRYLPTLQRVLALAVSGYTHPQPPQRANSVGALAVFRVAVAVTPTATAGNLLRASSIEFWSLHFMEDFGRPVMAKLAFRAA